MQGNTQKALCQNAEGAILQMLKSSTGSLQEKGVPKNPYNNLGDQCIQTNQDSLSDQQGINKTTAI